MNEKQKILRDPADNTPLELLDAIERGIVSLEELYSLPEEKYSNSAKAELRKEIDKRDSAKENEAWNSIQSCLDEKKLRDFIKQFPGGVHLREARVSLEDVCWKNLSSSHPKVCDIEKFLDEFPTGLNARRAEALLDGVKWEYSPAEKIMREERKIKDNNLILDKNGELLKYVLDQLRSGAIKSEDILNMLCYDHNAFNSFVVDQLVRNNYLTFTDLKKIGIDSEFLKFMKNNPPSSMGDGEDLPEPQGELTKIEDGFTEFYFWGIPSSGKTCALAAILSAANSGYVCKDFSPITNCQGYDYMTTLSEFFKHGIVRRLPGGTSVRDTYEMKFSLEGRYERKTDAGGIKYDQNYYKCAAIDLAGELFCCIHLDLAGAHLGEDQEVALENLKKILVKNKSKNRKIHFFVIEYGAENRMYKKHTQDVYLKSCMRYIEENNIFDKTTDRIYIVVTKCDKFEKTETKTESDILRKYITDNYLGFYKNLKNLCEKYDINDGEPGLIAYTIGDVCFQDYCRFHSAKSESVVYDCFLDTVYGHDKGFWGSLKRKLGL